jgi:hypothetical protein
VRGNFACLWQKNVLLIDLAPGGKNVLLIHYAPGGKKAINV